MEVWIIKKLIDGQVWAPVAASFSKDELEGAIKTTKRYFGGEYRIEKMYLTERSTVNEDSDS